MCWHYPNGIIIRGNFTELLTTLNKNEISWRELTLCLQQYTNINMDGDICEM